MIWPSERFYWTALTVPGYRKSGELPAALLLEVQRDVPARAEDLHAVCTPAANGALIVCAARRDQLAELPSDTTTLIPLEVPVELGLDICRGVEPGALNLLVGAFEAAPMRRARQRRRLWRCAVGTVCVFLLTVGFARRTQILQEDRRAAEQALQSISTKDRDGSIDLAHLTQFAQAARSAPAPIDASATLAEFLRLWPTDVEVTPQSVSISGASVTVSLSAAEPSQFLRRLKSPPGWKLEEPRVSQGHGASSDSQILLEFRPIVKEPMR